MTRSAALVPALLLALAAPASAAVIPLPPRPEKYATDRARVLDAARLAALNERLAQFERETSNQVLVYVDRKVPAGTTLEEMSTAAMRAWGVGQKGKRNGVVLFVFVDDRKMRIEVGYGLEGALPDAAAHRITDGVIKPQFKRGDYARGVEVGVDAVLAALRTEGNRGTGRTAAERTAVPRPAVPAAAAAPPPGGPSAGWLFVIAGVITGVLTFFRGDPLRWLGWGGIVAAPFGLGGGVMLLSVSWFVIGLVFLIGGILLVAFRWARRNPDKMLPGGPGASSWSWSWGSSSSSSSDSSWSSSSSSSDSGSSSDFSGGGGDSGGGGSSDSW